MAYSHKIPDNLNPAGTICVPVFLPEDAEYISLFLYVVRTLTHDRHYQRDANNSALTVRDVWRQTTLNPLISVLANGIACDDDMLVRQNPENLCILEQSEDGETWVEFADITACVDAGYLSSLIANNPALQQQIGQYSLTSAIDSSSDVVESLANSQIINNQAGCDDDNIYGMTLQFVELLNAVTEDILEIFVSAPTAISRLGDIIEAVPGIGELPLDDAFQFVESVLDDWNQAYQAAFTEALKIEIACDLYCIAQDSCTLTMEQARQYFYEKLAGMTPSDNYLQFMEQVIAFNWVGVVTVYGAFLLLVQTLITGGEVLGMDVNRIVRMVNAMFNDPNPDWATECLECPEFNNVLVTFDSEGYQEYTNLEGVISGSVGDPAPSADGVYNAGISTMRAVTRVDLLAEHTVIEVGMYSNVSASNWTALIELRDDTGTLVQQYLNTGNTVINAWEFNGTSGIEVAGVRYIDFYTALGSPSVEIYHDNLNVRYIV